MTRLALSIGKNFSDYGKLSEILNMQEFDELVSLTNKDVERYGKEFNKPIQFFKIDWGNIIGATNIKENKFGKPYNADAPLDAAHQVIGYADAYIQLGDGDHNINKLAKVAKLKEIKTTVVESKAQSTKRYKF